MTPELIKKREEEKSRLEGFRKLGEKHGHAIDETHLFCMYGFGIAGSLSDEAKATYEIAKRDDAEDTFVDIISPDEPLYSLHAIAGLKIINSDQLEAKAKLVSNFAGQVTYGRGGCCCEIVDMAETVKRILADPYLSTDNA
ncbi:hypothetical protein [Neptuniibacter sp. QD37_11]|uniref:hypothetical protein n=1 Tax=Neptuniibacter sp. QD37_11 TaxID=3398209 RepID=UPI0039F5AFEC